MSHRSRRLLLIAVFLIHSGNAVAMGSRQPPEDNQRPVYVIVHGAWGGGWDWKPIADRLRAAGHEAHRPTLTGLGERAHLATKDTNLSTHIQDIVQFITYEDLKSVVLVGHSYGGMVITGVADRMPERIRRLIYVDAVLPENGESVFDRHPALHQHILKVMKGKSPAWLIPPFWEDAGRDTPQPMAALSEKIRLVTTPHPQVPGFYILTREKGVNTDEFTHEAKRAKERGWPVFEMEADHNPQRSHPDELTSLILRARH